MTLVLSQLVGATPPNQGGDSLLRSGRPRKAARATNALSLAAEVLGFLFVHDAELNIGRVRGGVSYAIRDGIEVGAVGRGLGHDSPRLLRTVGVTFAY